jgi:hypothetical protein
VDRLLNATPRQILIAAGILLLATVAIAELWLVVDRIAMARYDPANIGEEVEEYLEQRERDPDAGGE